MPTGAFNHSLCARGGSLPAIPTSLFTTSLHPLASTARDSIASYGQPVHPPLLYSLLYIYIYTKTSLQHSNHPQKPHLVASVHVHVGIYIYARGKQNPRREKNSFSSCLPSPPSLPSYPLHANTAHRLLKLIQLGGGGMIGQASSSLVRARGV